MTPLDGEYKRIVCWMDGAALSLNHLSFAGHAFMVAANYYQLSKLIDIHNCTSCPDRKVPSVLWARYDESVG